MIVKQEEQTETDESFEGQGIKFYPLSDPQLNKLLIKRICIYYV